MGIFRKSAALMKKPVTAGLLVICIVLSVSFITSGSAAAYDADYLIPMGNAVGINLQTDGVLVVGVPDVLGDGVSASPARSAGITAGDIITQIGSDHVSTVEDLKAVVNKLDGSTVTLQIMRSGNTVTVKLTPHKTPDGKCELGLWMRDGIAGIGTLTFYDPKTGVFGALGHSVNDLETGVIIPLRTGTITKSTVTDVVLGKAGMPGQLHGSFNFDKALGRLTQNSPNGVFGIMDTKELVRGKRPLPVARSSEIKTGPATILSNVAGTEVKEYKVEITRIYTGAEAVGRSMMISVTDPALVSQTGGIVQGMSGSPIIQNGKLVGAVTHVLVNDPTRGYGISVEKMLDTISDKSMFKAA
jgi:stage IV sporulation protein B